MSLVVGLLIALIVSVPSSAALRLAALRPPTATAGRVRGSRRARRPPDDLALCLDLLAAALSSGQPVGAAVRTVGVAVGSPLGEALEWVGAALLLGAPVAQAWPSGDLAEADRVEAGPSDRVRGESLATIRTLLEVSLVAGGQASVVLRAGADSARRGRRRDNEARVARLPVRMVLPLGLCALPAFVAVAVVPVVVSIAENYLG